MRAWLLPEYIEDILPVEAHRIERLRRDVLDLFEVHGYELSCRRCWSTSIRC